MTKHNSSKEQRKLLSGRCKNCTQSKLFPIQKSKNVQFDMNDENTNTCTEIEGCTRDMYDHVHCVTCDLVLRIELEKIYCIVCKVH